MLPQRRHPQLKGQFHPFTHIHVIPSCSTQRRKKAGDNRKVFSEGWVEFKDKYVAKQVAATLNGREMGGKTFNKHRYDLWNLKYLPKFKWDHLTEEINFMKKVREKKLDEEIKNARKDRDFYLQQVGKAKAEAFLSERNKSKKRSHNDRDGAPDGDEVVPTTTTTTTSSSSSGGKEGGMFKKSKTQEHKDGKGNIPTEASPRPHVRHFGQKDIKEVKGSKEGGISMNLLQLISGKKKKNE